MLHTHLQLHGVLTRTNGRSLRILKKHFFFFENREATDRKVLSLFHLQMVNYTVPGSTLTTLIIALPLIISNDTQTVNGNPGAPMTKKHLSIAAVLLLNQQVHCSNLGSNSGQHARIVYNCCILG